MNWQELLQRVQQYPWMKAEFADNNMLQWTIAAAVVLLAFLAAKLILRIVLHRARTLSTRINSQWGESAVKTLEATKSIFLLILALYLATLLLDLPPRMRGINQSVVIVTLLLQAALWGTVLLDFAIERYMKTRLETDAAAATMVSALSFLGKLLLWSLVTLLVLDNVGVDVTALVASLGVGGIAVALAAQNILGDLFASLSIVMDKPFVLGDFIAVGDMLGNVEKIGLKTTRLRSLTGEQLIFSNNDLLSSRVRNFKRMYERRIVFGLGVIYQTPQEKLAAIPGMIREIVEAQEQARFDRSHFKAFGASSLDIETVYYVRSPEYVVYMDVQQAVNLAIFARFAEEGIEFAYPTQTLYLEKPEEEAEAS